MIDFTIERYKDLLQALIANNYNFQTFEEFIQKPHKRAVILRHDVDLLPENSLLFARIQKSLGIKGSYYFRAVPESWDQKIIQEIASLDHEIGYHYECLTTTSGNLKAGIKNFEKNLSLLRELAPVSTICMHGSPMSKYDSKDLWKTYRYQDYDIIAEPYFDVDYNTVFYITDTGRRWDGHKYSVRDRVNTKFTQTYHTTSQIIGSLNNTSFPSQTMFTFHPQRWNDNLMKWSKELVVQNVKNCLLYTSDAADD